MRIYSIDLKLTRELTNTRYSYKYENYRTFASNGIRFPRLATDHFFVKRLSERKQQGTLVLRRETNTPSLRRIFSF